MWGKRGSLRPVGHDGRIIDLSGMAIKGSMVSRIYPQMQLQLRGGEAIPVDVECVFRIE